MRTLTRGLLLAPAALASVLGFGISCLCVLWMVVFAIAVGVVEPNPLRQPDERLIDVPNRS